jgi:hypothetical protein
MPLLGELRMAAVALDAAGASRRRPAGQAGCCGGPAQVDELTLDRVHHFRKVAALCGMAARLLLDRASAGRSATDGSQDADELSSVSRFLCEQIEQLNQGKPTVSSAPSGSRNGWPLNGGSGAGRSN